jgi:ubiquinone biosynthesis protein
LRNLGRSREIATVLLNHGFGDLLEQLRLRRYLQWGRRLLFRKRRELEPRLTRAARIRLALESLGATFIKFGQVLSTRPDLVPADVIQELEKLQERVPPFSSETAVQVLEEELGEPVEKLFAEFERVPIAAASLSQVHRARRHDGALLAVKIRRPNVVRDVERDLSLMMEFAVLVERHIPEAQAFDPTGLVNHFARTIRRELNFSREGRTIDEFARHFRQDATLYIPKVYWELTTEAVLTMEYIDGCHVYDRATLEAWVISPRTIAAHGARLFMHMAFELGIFHGDPHPGNIRILRDATIALLDYGMIGILDEEKREQLIDLFLAVTRQDVIAAVQVVQTLGEPFRPVDVPLLRADVRDFVENHYGVPLEELDVGKMLSDFAGILLNHGIRCPPDLMLLIRTLVTLEGVGRELDPEFNLAEHLAPFVEKVVRERYNVQNIKRRLLAESRTFFRLAHDVPRYVAKSLEKLSKDDLKVQLEHRGLDHLITELDRSSNRVVISLVISSMIVSSALIIRSGTQVLWFSGPMLVLSSLLGAWLIYGVFRSGRL